MTQDPICGMPVNEKDALSLSKDGEKYYFCGQNCLNKFAEQNNISLENVSTCQIAKSTPIYKNKTFIVAMLLLFPVALSLFIPLLIPFKDTLFEYLDLIWWAILLGIVIGGVIEHFIPSKYISHILSRGEKKTIFYSVFLGFLMSACSHGILALAIQLHKKGASNAAVIAFLLASPWANVAVTIMLLGFFGLKALYLIFAAIIIAIITGFIFQYFEKIKFIEPNINQVEYDEKFSIKDDFKNRMAKRKISKQTFINDVNGIYLGAISLSNMVLWWILIGIGIASAVGAYIPEHFFHNYMDASLSGLGVTLLVATVIEVCSEGSAPMAFEVFKQTGALGNAFVFLMAGVATDYTEIGLLWHNVGKKIAIWLPIITVPQIIAFGWFANVIFK